MDFNGATPFWRAAFAQDLDAMKILAEHGTLVPDSVPELEVTAR